MGIFLFLNWMRFIEALQKSNESHFFYLIGKRNA